MIWEKLRVCSDHYLKWKEMALSATDPDAAKRYLERAFFWIELQSAFMALWALEQTQGKNPRVKKKLIIAKANLSRKLADYARQVLEDVRA